MSFTRVSYSRHVSMCADVSGGLQLEFGLEPSVENYAL